MTYPNEQLPAGRAKLAPMLAADGRLKGDLTVFNWGDGTWWIMGSYYLRQWHMRWFSDRIAELGARDVTVRDISDATVGFGLAGPRSRDVLAGLIDVEHAQVGEELHTHVVGVERGARIIESSPYDPGGAVMRR